MNLWDRQEGETANQYCWFNEFLLHNDYSLKNFYEKVNEESIESEQESQKNKKIPTYRTIQKWSSCNNWIKRKEAYKEDECKQLRCHLQELQMNKIEEQFERKTEQIDNILTLMDNQFKQGTLSCYQASQGANAISTLKDDNRKDLGEPTEITENKSQLQIESEQVTTETIYDKVDKALGITEDGNQEL